MPAHTEADDLEPLIRGVDALSQGLEQEVERLLAELRGGLRCGPGCVACCAPDVTVLRVEAEWIRRRVGTELMGAPPGPSQGCAFLDPLRRCRIYAFRPYVCRTQGLPLRWFEEDEQGEIQEPRQICDLNREAIALSLLSDAQCWLLGPYEARLVELEEVRSRGQSERFSLRRLFEELSAGR